MHALDTSLYAADQLTYASPSKVFPLIVCLEAAGGNAVQSQTTFASISPADASGDRKVTPLKQKIQVGQTSYELQEIYGIDGAASSGGSGTAAGEADASDGGGDNSRECVICMTEPRDTTVLPCRHIMHVLECAKMLRVQARSAPSAGRRSSGCCRSRSASREATRAAAAAAARRRRQLAAPTPLEAA